MSKWMKTSNERVANERRVIDLNRSWLQSKHQYLACYREQKALNEVACFMQLNGKQPKRESGKGSRYWKMR